MDNYFSLFKEMDNYFLPPYSNNYPCTYVYIDAVFFVLPFLSLIALYPFSKCMCIKPVYNMRKLNDYRYH